jgi:hypothetical protein
VTGPSQNGSRRLSDRMARRKVRVTATTVI